MLALVARRPQRRADDRDARRRRLAGAARQPVRRRRRCARWRRRSRCRRWSARCSSRSPGRAPNRDRDARIRFVAGCVAIVLVVSSRSSPSPPASGVGWLSTSLFSTPAKVHLAITPATAVGYTVAKLLGLVSIHVGSHGLESAFGVVATVISAALGLWLLLARASPRLVAPLGACLLIAAAGGPAAWPWYFTWGLVLVAACAGAAALAVVAAALVVSAVPGQAQRDPRAAARLGAGGARRLPADRGLGLAPLRPGRWGRPGGAAGGRHDGEPVAGAGRRRAGGAGVAGARRLAVADGSASGRPPASPEPASPARRRDAVAIAGPALLALVLSLIGITGRSLGFDEGATWAIASQHVPGHGLGAGIAHDGGNMLGLYALEHVLISAFGDSRLRPAAAGGGVERGHRRVRGRDRPAAVRAARGGAGSGADGGHPVGRLLGSDRARLRADARLRVCGDVVLRPALRGRRSGSGAGAWLVAGRRLRGGDGAGRLLQLRRRAGDPGPTGGADLAAAGVAAVPGGAGGARRLRDPAGGPGRRSAARVSCSGCPGPTGRSRSRCSSR